MRQALLPRWVKSTLVLRAMRHDAIRFAVNSLRASSQSIRRGVAGGKLQMARVRSRGRLHKQGLAARMRHM